MGAHKYTGKWQDRYSDKPPEKHKRKKSYKQTIETPASGFSGISFGFEPDKCQQCGHEPHDGKCGWKRQITGSPARASTT